MSKQLLHPEAKPEIDRLKGQVVQELGLAPMFETPTSRGDLPSSQAGRVGGEMVRRMVSHMQSQMAKGQS